MANPVLSRPDAFAPAYPGQPGAYPPAGAYPPVGTNQTAWGQSAHTPPVWGAPGGPGQPGPYGPPAAGQPPAWAGPTGPVQPSAEGRMTLDDVLTKSALTMGLLVLTAALSWLFLPLQLLMPAAVLCGLVSIIFPLVAAFRHRVGPVVAFGFAVLEGVFLGGLSKLFESYYEGIVFQAVVGTFMAAGATLAAFHFGKIRLSGKIRRIIYISLIAYAGVFLLNFVLYLCGINLGLVAGMTGHVPVLAWVGAGLGVVLAVLSLIDDFQYIEQGVKMGAPAHQSWQAAYGLTVTMVFLYTKILRILSYIRR
ncbi:MAG: Bax inhibitor-1/YccA family protein [Propionibacteriaceae bacterium]|nr:Bax inhibitor-1/YccA family protein [Propionibacteriaceae bacterium]